MKRLFILLVLATNVYAQEGVFEINQLCVETGCFSGDSAGFPITINQPGSYRFTSNVNISTNGNGILINSNVSDVTIDLNGFTLQGPVSCSGNPLVCTGPTNTGNNGRLIVTIGLAENIVIKNGNIRGAVDDGIFINSAYGNLITGINASENRFDGIECNQSCRVIGNSSSRNGEDGISGNARTVIKDNVIFDNAGNGIRSGICTGNVMITNEGDNETCLVLVENNICDASAC